MAETNRKKLCEDTEEDDLRSQERSGTFLVWDISSQISKGTHLQTPGFRLSSPEL